MDVAVLFYNVAGKHTCNGCCNGYGHILLELFCCDRRFKDDVFAVFAALKENSIRTVAAKGVIGTQILEIQRREIIAGCGLETNFYGVGLACLKYMVCLQKGFTLIPSKHLSKVVLPFVNTCIIGWGSANNGVRYVGVEVINRSKWRMLCFHSNDAVSGRRFANGKGKAFGSFIGIFDQSRRVRREIPLCKGLTFGIKALICNQRQGGTGKELGLVGLYAVKIELAACDLNANRDQIIHLYVGTDFCGSNMIAGSGPHLSVYAELGVIAHAIPFLGSNDVSALIECICYVGIGRQHLDARIPDVVPRFNLYRVKVAFGGNGGNGRATNRYFGHRQLDRVDRNGVDRLTNDNRGTAYPNVCWVVMVIGNVTVHGDLPHQKFFTLGGFVGFDVEASGIVKFNELLGVFA